MGNIYIGTGKLKNIYFPSIKAKKIYVGTEATWQSAIPISRPTSAQLNPTATYTGSAISNGFSMTGVEYVSGDTSGINASTYVAYYQPDEEHIWEDTEDRAQVAVTLTINAKSISGATVSVSSNPTYNGSSQSVTVSSVTIDGLSATFTVSGNSGTNAGSYTLTCTGTGNFTGTQTAGWSIGQATITSFSLNTTSRTYNGSSQSVSVSSVTAGSLSATYTTGGVYSATDAGSYTAYVYGSGNFTGTLSCGWTMNKANVSYTAPVNNSPTYNGSSQYIMTWGSVSGGTLYYRVSGGGWSTSPPTSTNAGSWDCYWYIAGDSNHNGVGETYVWCNLNKAAGSASGVSNASPTYNGYSQYICTAGSGTGTIYYSTDNSSWSTTRPSSTNAGSWYVYYYAAASTNYTQSSTQYVWCNLNKHAGYISLNSSSGSIYVGSSATFTVSSSHGGSLSVASSSSSVSASISGSTITYRGASVGSATLTVTCGATTNYTAASATFTATAVAPLPVVTYSNLQNSDPYHGYIVINSTTYTGSSSVSVSSGTSVLVHGQYGGGGGFGRDYDIYLNGTYVGSYEYTYTCTSNITVRADHDNMIMYITT